MKRESVVKDDDVVRMFGFLSLGLESGSHVCEAAAKTADNILWGLTYINEIIFKKIWHGNRPILYSYKD